MQHAATIDRTGRLRLAIGGPDRARFLHNLTTNDIKGLAVGAGCEAFVTNLQGKTLAFVTVHAAPDVLWLRTESASAEGLMPHLQKYALFDDVTIDDRSESTGELHLCGVDAGGIAEVGDLPDLGIASEELARIRESPTGQPGWTWIGPRERIAELGRSFADRGVGVLSADDFEALRIAAGTPLSGRDVTPDNLPQELDRDARAISFRKGCYLGQETVARLDALGHVNKIWRGLVVEGSASIPAGATLVTEDGKAAGTVTSGTVSGHSEPIAAGFVRVKLAPIGARLGVEKSDPPTFVQVVALPRHSRS